ncbi:hypothetical protein RV07_GL003500 [Enterococcus malodoratus]|nr:hypothetical protein RV07_GL003500 [Enterococcus malodoratus]
MQELDGVFTLHRYTFYQRVPVVLFTNKAAEELYMKKKPLKKWNSM